MRKRYKLTIYFILFYFLTGLISPIISIENIVKIIRPQEISAIIGCNTINFGWPTIFLRIGNCGEFSLMGLIIGLLVNAVVFYGIYLLRMKFCIKKILVFFMVVIMLFIVGSLLNYDDSATAIDRLLNPDKYEAPKSLLIPNLRPGFTK